MQEVTGEATGFAQARAKEAVAEFAPTAINEAADSKAAEQIVIDAADAAGIAARNGREGDEAAEQARSAEKARLGRKLSRAKKKAVSRAARKAVENNAREHHIKKIRDAAAASAEAEINANRELQSVAEQAIRKYSDSLIQKPHRFRSVKARFTQRHAPELAEHVRPIAVRTLAADRYGANMLTRSRIGKRTDQPVINPVAARTLMVSAPRGVGRGGGPRRPSHTKQP